MMPGNWGYLGQDTKEYFCANYDIIIMGDILEHLSREDGVKLLNKLKNKITVLLRKVKLIEI